MRLIFIENTRFLIKFKGSFSLPSKLTHLYFNLGKIYHSNLNASIGFKFVALFAGKSPKKIPTKTENPKASQMTFKENSAPILIMFPNKLAPPIPRIIPKISHALLMPLQKVHLDDGECVLLQKYLHKSRVAQHFQ